MKKLHIFIILLSILGFYSCEDVIDVELNQGQVQLIIDAWVNNGVKDQMIHLNRSTQYFDPNESAFVSDADVYILEFQGNGDAKIYTDTFSFMHTDSGKYIYEINDSADILGQVYGNYELHVIDGLDHYVGEAMCNRPVIMDSATWYYDDGTADILTPAGYYVLVYPRDPVGFNDIYRVMPFKNDTMLGTPANIIIAYDASFGFPSEYDGLQFIPPLRFSVNQTRWKEGDIVRVEYESMSIGAYEFYGGVRDQQSNSQFALFAAPVSNLRTNLTNKDTLGAEPLGFFNIGSYLEVAMEIGDSTKQSRDPFIIENGM